MIKINHITGEITVEYIVGGTGTRFILDANSSIKVDIGDAIFEDAAHGFNEYVINGTIRGGKSWPESALVINGDSSHVTVGKTGSLDANIGVSLMGPYETLNNKGHIHGIGEGVLMEGYSTMQNSGTISGEDGVMTAFESTSVTNLATGLITGTQNAVYFGGSGTQNSLTNYGILKGGQYGVHALDGDETIVNRGTIKGDIVLGGGDDSFDNRHGTVDHAVTGGAGDDTLIVDDGKTKLVESKGEGNDTVESSAAYKLGANVENLVLIGKGDINGTGNGEANELSGTNGDNVLVGKGGADTLNGHRGDDILSGGAGSDLFLFSKGSGHDVIKDFKPGEDHIDVSGLNGIVDFDEMIAHHLKVSGDDLVIHAGNDSITLEHVSKAALDFHDFYY